MHGQGVHPHPYGNRICRESSRSFVAIRFDIVGRRGFVVKAIRNPIMINLGTDYE